MNFPPGSWQLEAAKLVGAALFGLLVGVSIEFVKRRFARNQRLATFLTTVAGSLEGIASFFDKRETPYTHGHTLESAMAEFGRATRRILGDEALRLIRNSA
jgi:hypothetical protein